MPLRTSGLIRPVGGFRSTVCACTFRFGVVQLVGVVGLCRTPDSFSDDAIAQVRIHTNGFYPKNVETSLAESL